MPKKRRIFISFHSADRQRVGGFNLLPYNSNVDAEFSTRHLLSPVKSDNDSYVRRKISEQMKGTSATMVLLGPKTYEREWVAEEIKKTVENSKGVVAMRFKDEEAPLPPDSCVGKALEEAGAEVLDWDPNEIREAIERALLQTKRAKQIARVTPGSSGSCGRR